MIKVEIEADNVLALLDDWIEPMLINGLSPNESGALWVEEREHMKKKLIALIKNRPAGYVIGHIKSTITEIDGTSDPVTATFQELDYLEDPKKWRFYN